MKDREKAELTLIGIILNSDKRSYVFESVKEEDFGDDDLRSLYRKLLRHWKENGSSDFTAIADLLPKDEGIKYLKADDTFFPSIDVEGYVKAFNDDLTLEKLKNKASQIIRSEELDEAVSLGSELQRLARGVIQSKPLSFEEAADQFAADMSEEIRYIPSGYQKLDEYALIDKGDFIVLAGEQSSGKTAFSIGLMLNMARKGYRCVYFSLETSSMGIFYRAAAMTTGIPFAKILRRKLDVNDQNKYNREWDNLKRLPITVVEAAGWTVDKIRAEAIRLDAEVVFIDYIGLIKSNGKSRYEQITNTSIELHQMAQSAGITIVCLSQQNRGTDNSMHSLKDSGQLESDADLVLILTRKDPKDKTKDKWETELYLAKNKKGKSVGTLMWFDGVIQRFTQMTSYE